MPNVRGVDIIGQGLMSGMGGFFENLSKLLAEQKRQKEVGNIVSGLQQGEQPTNYAPRGGIQNPNGTLNPLVGSGGTPMFSQDNFQQLGRLAELSPNTFTALKATQPQPEVMQTFRGGLEKITKQPWGDVSIETLREGMPERPSASGMTQVWADALDDNGQPIVGVVNGVKSKLQERLVMNPFTNEWETKKQWSKYDQSSSTNPANAKLQLKYTNRGFMNYNPKTGELFPVGGDVQWKPAPDAVRMKDSDFADNLNSIKAIEDIVNRGSSTGPVVGRARQFGSRFFNDQEVTALQSRVGQLRTIVYALSGKQINEQEFEWLTKEIIPQIENPDQNFETKLGELKTWLTNRRGSLNSQYPELDKEAGTFPPSNSPTKKTIGW